MRWLLLGLTLALPFAALAQQPAAEPPQFDRPQGLYAKIDIRETDLAIRRLGQLIPGPRREAIAHYLERAPALAPPALYALANAFAQDDRQVDTAVFWYHVARIRAVYDALRCKDATARNALAVLGKGLNPDIPRYQRQRRQRTLEIAQLALDWDAKHPRNYDHRWVNLWGKVARSSAGADPAELTLPESEWPALLQRAREGHLKSVQEFAAVK
jgi:hypothetical protein